MIPRTSAIANALADALLVPAMAGDPIPVMTAIDICELLRFISAQCAEMERRLVGQGHPHADSENVIVFDLRRQQRDGSAPAGDA